MFSISVISCWRCLCFTLQLEQRVFLGSAMRFTVIEGGKSASSVVVDAAPGISINDVRREAARRCDALGINRLRTRQFVMGVPVPPDLHYLGLQIEFAAEKLGSLVPVPLDFQSNIYWPA
jgi:hypothetical protein